MLSRSDTRAYVLIRSLGAAVRALEQLIKSHCSFGRKGAQTCPVAPPIGGAPRSCYWSPTASSLPFNLGEHPWQALPRVDLPQRSVLEPLYAKSGFADAFAIDLPSNATGDAKRLAAHVLMGQPRWVGWLIAIRDTLVAGFGLKTSSALRNDGVATDRMISFGSTIGVVMRLFLARTTAISTSVLSVLVEKSALCRRLVATTVVTFNHWGGRAYIAGIALPSPDRKVVLVRRNELRPSEQ